ncbi:hypothetical protein [Vibrio sp. Evd11]|nr:hypothetical protein [Vibrio sp. Evd11]
MERNKRKKAESIYRFGLCSGMLLLILKAVTDLYVELTAQH